MLSITISSSINVSALVRWSPCDGEHQHLSAYTLLSTDRYYYDVCPTKEHLAYTCYKEIKTVTCKWCGEPGEIIKNLSLIHI